MHALPGIDDGPGEIGDSLALLEAAAAGGTMVVCATPHLRDDHPDVRPEELRGRCDELAASAPVEIVPGGELDLGWALRASDADLRLVSYGQRGTDLLIETPYCALTPGFEDQLFGLAVRGFRVMLAHPERNPTLQRDAARLAGLAARGSLLQVTAASLTARRRSRARRTAAALVREGLAHALASDAHSATGARHPGLQDALNEALRLAGPRAERLVRELPAAILAGEPLAGYSTRCG